MKVFKFGGASIKNADAVRNMASIVKSFDVEELVIVVSAMGKTTNNIERILNTYSGGDDHHQLVKQLRAYHLEIINDLFGHGANVIRELEKYLDELQSQLALGHGYDQTYDQVVSLGEMISSCIVIEYLISNGISIELVDARKLIATDSTFREGKIDWSVTEQNIRSAWQNRDSRMILTQGFIGGTTGALTTTLGREGSDFTAAIFGACLGSESVTIWKDVPGVMTADPKRIPNANVFGELPYKEAAEMTYYGASVIHPKTIRPLAMKGIPLFVRSFDDPKFGGTIIRECEISHLPPLVVFKENQCLISCKVTDFSFVNETQLTQIFTAISELNIKINVMQNSAISFSFCIDFNERKVTELIGRLKDSFEVYYNTGLTLITVKNYDSKTFEEYRQMNDVILEQFSRSTLQVLVKTSS